MRIAYFTDSFLPQINGVTTTLVNLSNKLTENGNEIIIFAPKSKEKTNYNILSKKVKIIYLPAIKFFLYPEYYVAMPSIIRTFKNIKKFEPDIIHIHTSYPVGWLGVFAAKTFKIPLIGTYHTIVPYFMQYYKIPIIEPFKEKKIIKNIAFKITNSAYNKCDLITTPSNAIKKELINEKLRVEIKVIPNGIDINSYRKFRADETIKKKADKIITKKDFAIMHFGRISYEKNISFLIKAFKIAFDKVKNPNLKLIIAGKGQQLDELKKFAEKLGIRNNIIFTGFLEKPLLLELLRRSKIFATASNIETQGIVITEAMAMGLPAIGPDKLGAGELIKQNKNGLKYTPNNNNDFAKCLIELIENSAKRKQLGKNAENIDKKYYVEEMINSFEKIYNQFANKK